MSKVLVIADTHVGSDNGLSTPEGIAPDKRETTDCLGLYEKFCVVLDWVGKVDWVFHLGDGCDGWNPREHGDNRTATENDQVKRLVQLLRMVKGSPKFCYVDGTAYHRGSRQLDEQVAKAIGAEPHPIYGYHAHPSLNKNVDGLQFNLCHCITVS